MTKLKIIRKKMDDWEHVELCGLVNEEANELFIKLQGETKTKFRFIFRDVTNISSSGVRAWLLFLHDFHVNRQLELAECSSAIVEQLNMIPNFSSHTKVTSIYATYFCTECLLAKNVLIEAADFPRLLKDLASAPCEKCGRPTDLDGGDGIVQFLSY